jgi:hypothetical protein
MNNIKRNSYVYLHFVSNKTYSIFQNRSAVLKLFHLPPKYYSASLSTTYLWHCHVRRERVMLCVQNVCFIICNLYYNAWIVYHLKMRTTVLQPLKQIKSYHAGWGPPSSYILSNVAHLDFKVGQPWSKVFLGLLNTKIANLNHVWGMGVCVSRCLQRKVLKMHLLPSPCLFSYSWQLKKILMEFDTMVVLLKFNKFHFWFRLDNGVPMHHLAVQPCAGITHNITKPDRHQTPHPCRHNWPDTTPDIMVPFMKVRFWWTCQNYYTMINSTSKASYHILQILFQN